MFDNKGEAIAHVINSFDSRIDAGKIFKLSNIRDQVSHYVPSEIMVYNRDVEQYLIDNFDHGIEFPISSNKNKSALFYS